MSTSVKRKNFDAHADMCTKLEDYCSKNNIPFSKIMNLLIERFLNEIDREGPVLSSGPKIGIAPPGIPDKQSKPIPMCKGKTYKQCSDKQRSWLNSYVFPALRIVHGGDCDVFEEVLNYASPDLLFETVEVIKESKSKINPTNLKIDNERKTSYGN